jgi:phosphatidylglycerophosphatase A
MTPHPTSMDPPPIASRRPDPRFALSHPAHLIALGFGAGLSPAAPGTVGTLWAWLTFVLLNRWLSEGQWAIVIGATLLVSVWASTVAARHLAVADPGAIVIDEIVAFWIVLWLVMPASFVGQLVAFALFRFFDAVKPAPVAWADRYFKPRRGEPIGVLQGFGIVFDDLIAALLTLLVIAGWRFVA